MRKKQLPNCFFYLMFLQKTCCEDCINDVALVIVCPETKTDKIYLIFQRTKKTLSFITGSMYVCVCVYARMCMFVFMCICLCDYGRRKSMFYLTTWKFLFTSVIYFPVSWTRQLRRKQAICRSHFKISNIYISYYFYIV